MASRKAFSVSHRLGFDLLFTKHPLPMWVYDLATLQFLEVNDAAVARYGYARDEWLKMRVADIRVSEGGETVLDPSGGFRPDAQYSVTRRHRLKSGEVIDVHVVSQMLPPADRPAVLAVVQDITQHKRAEAALQQSEERYRNFFDDASDAVYTLDREERFTSVNARALDLTGYTREEALTLDLARVVDPEYRDLVAAMMALELAGEDHGPYEIRMIVKDGRRIPVELDGRAIYEDRQPVGFRHIARDLTRRKRAGAETHSTIDAALAQATPAEAGAQPPRHPARFLDETLQDALRALPDGARQLVHLLGTKEVALEVEEHLAGVGQWSLRLAQQAGLDPDRRSRLAQAALLHDVGKLGLPRGLLDKPGPLSAHERTRLVEHVTKGVALLRILDVDEPVVAIVAAHHERWDGAGYPGHLAGDAIPLEARILAIGDSYEAMTAGRVYRKARTVTEAVSELERGAGRQFDPGLVELFISLLPAGR